MTQYFDKSSSPAELKLQYRAHCAVLHPDCGGSADKFIAMRCQYEVAAGLQVEADNAGLLDFTVGSDVMEEALVTANSRIECYCNFGSGTIAFQTFDCRVAFVVQEGVTDLYVSLKRRSSRYIDFRGNAQGRTVVLTGREFSTLWNNRLKPTTGKQYGSSASALGRTRRSARLTGSR